VSDRGSQALTDRRPLVAVLRLVVTGRGRVLYGEAIDAETEVGRRFNGWRGMTAAIRALVAEALERPAGDGDSPTDKAADAAIEAPPGSVDPTSRQR
jgi:hypothetical protein